MRPFKNRKRRGGCRQGIRTYRGFGKFEGNDVLSLVAYDMAMDSTDIHSDEHGGGSASLVEYSDAFYYDYLRTCRDAYRLPDGLNKRERKQIRSYVGFIVYESSQGFISVDWFVSRKHMMIHWDNLEKQFYPEEESEDED